jgi:hypothetical protein
MEAKHCPTIKGRAYRAAKGGATPRAIFFSVPNLTWRCAFELMIILKAVAVNI